MKHTVKRITALVLVLLTTASLLASCSKGENENTATEVDGIPVYEKYASREIDLGLTRDETILNVIEVNGEIRATIGVNEHPYVRDEDDTIPYRTEYRYYDIDYVETDTARREKTKSYHEIAFVSDPSVDFVVGGEPFEDRHDKGVQYHYYRNGEMEGNVLDVQEDPEEFGQWSRPFGMTANVMLYEDVPFLGMDIGGVVSGKGIRGIGGMLFICDKPVATTWRSGMPNDFFFRGLIGIDGVPYALATANEKGLLVPLTPETTELTAEGTEIEGTPTGGAFTDGRFGYFLNNTEIWRTDGRESQCLIDLAPYGCTQTSPVRAVSALSDGRILVVADDKLIELFASDGSEEGTRIYTIGTLDYDGEYGNTNELSLQVARYNEQSTNAFFKIKEFEEKSKLNLALLSGEIAMVITPDRVTLQNYVKQGVLAPLEEVAPALFEKDVLIENIVDATRVDGVCYYLPVNFEICGEAIAEPGKLMDGKLFETRKVYCDYIVAHYPDYFKYNNKTEILNNFTRDMDEWIDWENATCHFDDGTFAEILEFCTQGTTWEEQGDHLGQLWASQEQWERSYMVESFSLKDAVESYRFTDVKKAQEYQIPVPNMEGPAGGVTTWVQLDFPMPSRVYKGFEINAHNLYAVADNENSRDAADLLEWLILEEVVEEFPVDFFWEVGWDGFSVNRDETDRYLRRLLDGTMDFEEEKALYSIERQKDAEDMAYLRDRVNRHNMTCGQTQYEITWRYIQNADHLQYYKNEISAVIQEEAGNYFSGMISAKQAADYVQNRISLYLAEQS
ncbi:MAG: hypothetical protein IJF34_07460 [Clostridia bacterium]|nr:hypothetical protein [Clostridia bacterium]